MTVQEYGLKFTQLSRYAPDMITDMRGRMGMYVDGLNRGPKRDGSGEMLVSDMDVGRLMMFVQQADEERQHDREEFRSKKAKTSSHEVGKKGNGNWFPAPSSASAPAPRIRNDQKSQNVGAHGS
ncbi:MAG: hypothetical protein Q8850_02650 [Candidatus Phytoplasma australasiaticum]|nr:hypothetical protein [Candidatus Phytoplasma australasiaticum]